MGQRTTNEIKLTVCTAIFPSPPSPSPPEVSHISPWRQSYLRNGYLVLLHVCYPVSQPPPPKKNGPFFSCNLSITWTSGEGWGVLRYICTQEVVYADVNSHNAPVCRDPKADVATFLAKGGALVLSALSVIAVQRLPRCVCTLWTAMQSEDRCCLPMVGGRGRQQVTEGAVGIAGAGVHSANPA